MLLGHCADMQEQAMAVESLARIHDAGVLLGSAQLPHILVQCTKVCASYAGRIVI